MKIPNSSRRRQGGMAVIVILALLSIMLVCIGANIQSLNRLNRELKLLEQRQTRRLAAAIVTNTPSIPPPAPLVSP